MNATHDRIPALFDSNPWAAHRTAALAIDHAQPRAIHRRIPGHWLTRLRRRWALFWGGRWKRRFWRCKRGHAVEKLWIGNHDVSRCRDCDVADAAIEREREREQRIEEMAEAFRRANNG